MSALCIGSRRVSAGRRLESLWLPLPFLSAPEIGFCEIDDFVGPTIHHGFHHVEGEAFCYLQRNCRRHVKLGAVNHGVDQNGAVMRESSGDSVLDLGGVLDVEFKLANSSLNAHKRIIADVAPGGGHFVRRLNACVAVNIAARHVRNSLLCEVPRDHTVRARNSGICEHDCGDQCGQQRSKRTHLASPLDVTSATVCGGLAGHAHVVRIIPLDMFLTPQRVNDWSPETLGESEDLIMSAVTARAAQHRYAVPRSVRA
jgi:hypothetical protein